jgi:hypothetical protein
MTILMYECDTTVNSACTENNILTPEGFKIMKTIEDFIRNLDDYPKFCLATSVSDTTCS